MKKLFITGCMALIAGLGTLQAQNADAKWGVGVHVSTIDYKGDIGSNFFKFQNGIGGGVHVNRYLSPSFDAQGFINYGKSGHTADSLYNFSATMLTANLNLKYKFNNGYIFKEEAVIAPYLLAGFGETFVQAQGVGKEIGGLGNVPNQQTYDKTTFSDLNVGAGIGINFRLMEMLNLFVQTYYHYPLNDRYDGSGRPWGEFGNDKVNDRFLKHSLGLTLSLGKAKDTDGDGVPDSKDDCPETAGLEALNGCPDTDGDGVADRMDACPKVAGLEQFGGCPDTDGDGIPDTEDKCPKVAGVKDFGGCPDTDGDGVPDSEDVCPKVAGEAKWGGCADSDGDGIPDNKDACPNVSGTVNGCPDGDGDGVADKDDICPTVAGIASNKGCPEVKQEDTKVLEEALHGVKFESSKDIIKSSSFAILDNVVRILKAHPEYKLNIDGHTDSQGDDKFNMDLSVKRAEAVKKYLVDHGIADSRLTAEGHGETVPVATNDTAAGRAENRRVELKIQF